MKICIQSCMILLATAIGVNTPNAWAADPHGKAPVVNGERILSEKCARCHAIGKTGESPLTAAPPFRKLAAKYPLDYLAEALAEGITTGHAEMPEFVFATDEIEAILAYIMDISEPPAAR